MNKEQKAKLRAKLIECVPEKIIKSFPENDRKNKFCFIFLGDRKEGTMNASTIESDGDFIQLICLLMEHPDSRKELLRGLEVFRITNDINIKKKDKTQEMENAFKALE